MKLCSEIDDDKKSQFIEGLHNICEENNTKDKKNLRNYQSKWKGLIKQYGKNVLVGLGITSDLITVNLSLQIFI